MDASVIGKWALWALLLLIQQSSHTFSSRAKNGTSYLYNTIVAVFSNGSWFISQLILVDNFIATLASKSWAMAAFTGGYYVVFCVAGSVLAQWLAINYIEKRMDVGCPSPTLPPRAI